MKPLNEKIYLTERIRQLELEDGDIMWITIGGDIGNGEVWLPTEEDLIVYSHSWEKTLRDWDMPNVKLAVTSHIANIRVVKDKVKPEEEIKLGLSD